MDGFKERGQALLIVVLVMVVSLTIGLSVASRSITNLRTSKEEESSQRAFSAAEAGVERAIKANCQSLPCPTLASSFSENSSNYNAQTTYLSGTNFLVNGGNIISKNDGTDIWFVSHKADGTLDYSATWNGSLTLYWGSVSDVCDSDPAKNTAAALEIILIRGTKDSPVASRFGVDKCSSRAGSNKFDAPGGGGTVGGKVFSSSYVINNITSGIVARIVPLYANTTLGVSGGNNALPSQGKIINSTGESGTTSRKITVFQGYPSLPSEFFQYILFAPN